MADSYQITDPFDPTEISIDTKYVSMDTLLRRLQQGTIKLNPDFQRKEVWNEVSRSRLIESLMLNIPIQMFYVSADSKNNWTVVDGLQRISTFRDFVLGKAYMRDPGNPALKGRGFKLRKLEFLIDQEGRDMKTIEKEAVGLYNRIMETEFTFTIINPGTHEEVKRNIFKRINTGGEPLKPQEMRNALYAGDASNLLKKLADNPLFIRATDKRISSLRMEDQEWVLGLLAFMIRPYHTFTKALSVDDWLSDTMLLLNSCAALNGIDPGKICKSRNINIKSVVPFTIGGLEDRFNIAMRRSLSLFGKHTFRASCGNMRRTPINRRLFESWGVLLSQLSDEEYSRLLTHRHEFMVEYELLLKNSVFKQAISKHGMEPAGVKRRFEEFANLIDKYGRNATQ